MAGNTTKTGNLKGLAVIKLSATLPAVAAGAKASVTGVAAQGVKSNDHLNIGEWSAASGQSHLFLDNLRATGDDLVAFSVYNKHTASVTGGATTINASAMRTEGVYSNQTKISLK